jgi:predicted HTH domain antitoxin
MAQPHVTVSVDLPPDAQREPIEALSGRLRLLWVLDEVRQGHMTRVRAAELVGLALDAFLREAAARGVDAIDYDIDDFRREIGRAS